MFGYLTDLKQLSKLLPKLRYMSYSCRVIWTVNLTQKLPRFQAGRKRKLQLSMMFTGGKSSLLR